MYVIIPSIIFIVIIGTLQLFGGNPDHMVWAGFCAVIVLLVHCVAELRKLNTNLKK